MQDSSDSVPAHVLGGSFARNSNQSHCVKKVTLLVHPGAGVQLPLLPHSSRVQVKGTASCSPDAKQENCSAAGELALGTICSEPARQEERPSSQTLHPRANTTTDHHASGSRQPLAGLMLIPASAEHSLLQAQGASTPVSVLFPQTQQQNWCILGRAAPKGPGELGSLQQSASCGGALTATSVSPPPGCRFTQCSATSG